MNVVFEFILEFIFRLLFEPLFEGFVGHDRRRNWNAGAIGVVGNVAFDLAMVAFVISALLMLSPGSQALQFASMIAALLLAVVVGVTWVMIELRGIKRTYPLPTSLTADLYWLWPTSVAALWVYVLCAHAIETRQIIAVAFALTLIALVAGFVHVARASGIRPIPRDVVAPMTAPSSDERVGQPSDHPAKRH